MDLAKRIGAGVIIVMALIGAMAGVYQARELYTDLQFLRLARQTRDAQAAQQRQQQAQQPAAQAPRPAPAPPAEAK